MLVLAEHVANCGVILLFNVELDIFHSDIPGAVLFIGVRSLAVISELTVNDVNVLDAQLALTTRLFFVDTPINSP